MKSNISIADRLVLVKYSHAMSTNGGQAGAPVTGDDRGSTGRAVFEEGGPACRRAVPCSQSRQMPCPHHPILSIWLQLPTFAWSTSWTPTTSPSWTTTPSVTPGARRLCLASSALNADSCTRGCLRPCRSRAPTLTPVPLGLSASLWLWLQGPGIRCIGAGIAIPCTHCCASLRWELLKSPSNRTQAG